MLSRLRRALPVRASAFSTAAVCRNEPSSNPLGELAKVLDEQAARPQPGRAQENKSQQRTTNRPVHEYKPIQPYQFIRPHDLSLEGRKWPERSLRARHILPQATQETRKSDVFYQLGLDPLKFSMHPAVLAPFMSEMAMIHPRRHTGLTMKSQRRIAKAIRRAKMMGVIPLHSRPQASALYPSSYR
ncbi:hypothetical protein C8R43DRAFT_1117579 [Mycena crocata]|nr:hypothetical protein C8R43DRAFT_1117579 [Mycena crocata]